MKPFRFSLALVVAVGLHGLAACKKESPEVEGLTYVKGLPYYRFTDADRLWLRAKQGDERKFENILGYRRVYRVSAVLERVRAEQKEFTGPGLLSNSAVLVNYYDQTTVRMSRIDSILPSGFVLGGGDLRFYRAAALLSNLSSGGRNKNASRFYAKGEWSEFVGNTDLISDYYYCRGLKFPNGSALNGPFTSLTVRGRQYTEVVAFIGTSRGSTCAPVSQSYMQELYYDRQAGILRMVSVAGEVWDRVP